MHPMGGLSRRPGNGQQANVSGLARHLTTLNECLGFLTMLFHRVTDSFRLTPYSQAVGGSLAVITLA